MQLDADKEGHIAATEPDDLEAILKRLRMLLAGNPDLKSNASARILAALGIKSKSDSDMDDKEFQEAIAVKDSEMEEMKKSFEDAQALIKAFEEKERKNHIATIKKFSDKYSDEELENKNLESLETIADAVTRFAPSIKEPEVLPVAPKGDKEEMKKEIEDGGRIDPFSIYDDINKEFNMNGIRVK